MRTSSGSAILVAKEWRYAGFVNLTTLPDFTSGPFGVSELA